MSDVGSCSVLTPVLGPGTLVSAVHMVTHGQWSSCMWSSISYTGTGKNIMFTVISQLDQFYQCGNQLKENDTGSEHNI